MMVWVPTITAATAAAAASGVTQPSHRRPSFAEMTSWDSRAPRWGVRSSVIADMTLARAAASRSGLNGGTAWHRSSSCSISFTAANPFLGP